MSHINIATQDMQMSGVSRHLTRNPSSFPFAFQNRDRSPNYLQSELDRLRSLSDAVRDSGSVAPASCWLVEAEQRKGKRIYRYVQLRSDSKQIKKRSSFTHGKNFNRA